VTAPRDWQDRYYDGDDLDPADEHLFPIDDEDDTWDDDDSFILDLFANLFGLTADEEEDDEYGL
jgi:hypothetical protein